MSERDGAGREDAVGGGMPTGIRVHLFALLGYFILAVVATYPVVLHFTASVPGDLLADRDQNLWNLWWVKEALGSGANPFHTNLLYYPYGTNLYYHTLGLPLGLIGLLPQVILGLPAAYNTVLIVGFTLSGYGAFRLALLFVVKPSAVGLWAAFLGGVVFAFTPYTLDALKGQPEVLSLQWMPLYAEMWIRTMRAAGSNRWWRYALVAGLFLALAAYSSLYYAVYMVVFTIAHIGYRLFVDWRDKSVWVSWRIVGVRGLVVAAVTLGLSLPLLIGLIADHNNPRLAVAADPEHRLTHSADVLSFFAPPHDHLLFGSWQDEPGVNEPPIHDYVGLGYAALALAIIGGVAGWRRRGTRFWVGLGFVALVLAMGPQLQVGRNLTGVPLPFALIENVPGIDAIAKPERFVVLVRLCMGVLAALGAGWVFERVAGVDVVSVGRGLGRRAGAAGAVVLVLLLVELPFHPRYMGAYEIPQGFQALAQQSQGGLMELPFATQQVDTVGQRMLYQTTHGMPIMAGYLSRNYNSPIIDSCSPFWGVISPLDVPKEDIATPLVVNRLQDVLGLYGIKYIALYTKFGGPEGNPVDGKQENALKSIVSLLSPGQAFYDDGYVALHDVARADLSSALPSFHIGAGWYNVEQSEGTPFRWVSGREGTLCVFAPREVTATLHLEATAFGQEQQVSVSASGNEVFAGKLAAGAFTSVTTAAVVWQPGVTEVQITASGQAITPQSLDPGKKDARALTVGLRRVSLAIEARK